MVFLVPIAADYFNHYLVTRSGDPTLRIYFGLFIEIKYYEKVFNTMEAKAVANQIY